MWVNSKTQHSAAHKWEIANMSKSVIFDKWSIFGIMYYLVLATWEINHDLCYHFGLCSVDCSHCSGRLKRKGIRIADVEFLAE